jgi:hypothetical protein
MRKRQPTPLPADEFERFRAELRTRQATHEEMKVIARLPPEQGDELDADRLEQDHGRAAAIDKLESLRYPGRHAKRVLAILHERNAKEQGNAQ